MKNRDIITEIIAKKQRIEDWQRVSFKVFEIKQSLDQFKIQELDKDPIFSLYLVGLASCIELATRIAIKDLIDYGLPYIERVQKFEKLLRFDLEITRALSDKKITFGEFIAHLLPISSIGQINSHLDILFEESFRSLISQAREYQEPDIVLDDRVADEEEVKNPEKFINQKQTDLIILDVEQIMKDLAQIFQFRHIIAHEANFSLISYSDLDKYISSTATFVTAIEELVAQTLYPDFPRSTFGMSYIVMKEVEKISEELEESLEQLIKLYGEFTAEDRQVINEIKKAQDAFFEYVKAEQDCEMFMLRGISGNGLRLADASLKLTLYRNRLERVNKIVTRIYEG